MKPPRRFASLFALAVAPWITGCGTESDTEPATANLDTAGDHLSRDGERCWYEEISTPPYCTASRRTISIWTGDGYVEEVIVVTGEMVSDAVYGTHDACVEYGINGFMDWTNTNYRLTRCRRGYSKSYRRYNDCVREVERCEPDSDAPHR